ncbi:UPF0496 protein At1g20180-like [Magnolia sinica]|uniref:UPF0496 protein At1g20180-like n=1 Tax=Magnolia sinica TaxID=86752 RepID=UPI00265ACF07|nr:UPF0496 protein At1g20180-like [Magnolia sinica]
MWTRLRRSMKIVKAGGDKSKADQQSFNVNEEYLSVFRTESYADFFTKAQLLVTEATSSSPLSRSYTQLSQTLLQPGQETIAHVLESAVFFKNSDLKDLVLDYFNVSAEASRICSYLLQSINQTQSNHQFIQNALEIIGDYSPDQFESVISELDAFRVLNNPFSNVNGRNFKVINERYSSILHHLKSRRRKVTRKIKAIKYFKQGSRICLTVACGAVAVVAVVLAVHTLAGLLLGPAIFCFSPPHLKKKFLPFRSLRSRLLKKQKEQLDVAAKGTYILNRDFDTMSRLVTWVHDEIEHNKAMIEFCIERREDKYPVQEVIKELRKSDEGFRKQVNELEEHVYLCLVTINRARIQVVKEISTSVDR